MENILYYSHLFDYYGGLLTDIQQHYFQDYYFNNLTIIEIAANYNISKNAVSKTLKEVVEKLNHYEKELHLYQNRIKIESLIKDSKIIDLINEYI